MGPAFDSRLTQLFLFVVSIIYLLVPWRAKEKGKLSFYL